MPRYYKSDAADFQLWLSQPVWVGNDQAERATVIPYILGGLSRFMKAHGYTMDSDWNAGNGYHLAKWMYDIHVQEYARMNLNGHVKIPDILHRNTNEDMTEFYHTISCERIEAFMEGMQEMEDLDMSSRTGQRIFHGLQDFLYRFVDLESSKQGRLIAEMWDDSGSDSDEEFWNKKRDVYLVDTTRGYHG
jgi:hypothetical protein